MCYCYNKMKMKIHLFILLALCICLCGCNKAYGQKEEIRRAVVEQMRVYPQSTLRDIYKNFFQDCFGPGHIIADTISANTYLREELAKSVKFSGQLYERTGYKGNFYRVNLSLIKDGVIPYNIFFNAFVRSVNGIRPTPIEEWEKEWHLISTVISEMNLQMDGYKQDSLQIDNLLEQGQYVMHHSQKYVDAYDPHYRIISKEIFEAELLPLIERHNREK